MKRMSVHEAKAHFSAVLKEVSEGETVIVTEHDKPIAEICPVKERKVPILGAFADGGPHLDISWTEDELYEL